MIQAREIRQRCEACQSISMWNSDSMCDECIDENRNNNRNRRIANEEHK